MAFDFPLQAVLHLRESIEHQQEIRLRAANQQVARVRHLIEQLESRSSELYSRRAAGLSSGITSAELRFELLGEAELGRHRKELEREVLRLEHLRDQQREIYQKARQALQTLESLRDRQLALYRKEAARREQRKQDDLFLMRREYLRRS
jgi:flagellar export protein FliJ